MWFRLEMCVALLRRVGGEGDCAPRAGGALHTDASRFAIQSLNQHGAMMPNHLWSQTAEMLFTRGANFSSG